MATLGEIKIMLEGVRDDVSEIKTDVKTMNGQVRTNEKDIVRLFSWTRLTALGVFIVTAVAGILRATGAI